MSSYHSGLTGEELASAHLRGLGLRVIKTRYRADGGEIDIIAHLNVWQASVLLRD